MVQLYAKLNCFQLIKKTRIWYWQLICRPSCECESVTFISIRCVRQWPRIAGKSWVDINTSTHMQGHIRIPYRNTTYTATATNPL